MPPYVVNTKAYYCNLMGKMYITHFLTLPQVAFFFSSSLQKPSACPLEQVANGKVMKCSRL